MRRILRPALALLLAAPLLAACSGRAPVRAGEARLEPDGVVLVAAPGADFERVTKARTLKGAARVRVASGTAAVHVAGAELGLRTGSEILLGRATELVAGDLLVVARRPLVVRAAGSDLGVSGAARLARGLAVSAAAYQGDVDVRSAGDGVRVPALRQVTVPALGQVPDAPDPLSYDAGDPWDRRFLAEAIDLAVELQSRSDGATAQFRGQGRTPGFYRLLLPALEGEAAFGPSLLDATRPAGENLVGASIVLAGRRGTFAERWNSVFGFRAQGATWGLVALDQGVARTTGLLRTLDEALGRANLPGEPAVLASDDDRPRGGTSAPVGGGDDGRAPGTTTPTTTRRPGPPPTTGTTTTTAPPIVTVPRLPTDGTAVDPVADATVDTINGLLPRQP